MTGVIARLTARRTTRAAALWGAAFGTTVITSVSAYAAVAGTGAERTRFAESLRSNAGLTAVLGAPRRLDTVAGFTAWRCLGVLGLVGAVWGLLTGTRSTRGEEDAGRWELLLAGRTTRRNAALEALAGLAAGLGALWVVTAILTVSAGLTDAASFTIAASCYFSLALVAPAALFLVVGALAGEVAPQRRRANGLGALVLALSLVLRMVADAFASWSWMRWLTPLGWVEELRPLTGSRPLAFVPIVGFLAVATWGCAWIADRRDVGAGAFAEHDRPEPHTALLGGPTGLAVRLARPGAIGWIAGVGVFGVFAGLIAKSTASAVEGNSAYAQITARLGVHSSGAATYVGVLLVVIAAAIAFAAAGQVGAARSEEGDGRLDQLVSRGVTRRAWLAGRAAVAAVLVVAISLTVVLGTWVGAATQHTGLGIGDLLRAGLALAPPAMFVLGLGVLATGVAPRLGAAATYGIVAWSFLLELIGAGLKLDHWLLDTSLLGHLAPAPAVEPQWTASLWMLGLGVAGAAIGVVAFGRRDLAGA